MRYFKVAVHALIKNGQKILITKRSAVNDYMPNFWDIPGGTVEFGEEIDTTLSREILEETGLKVEIGKIIFAYGYLSGKERHQFQLVYQCNYLGGSIRLDPQEHCEYEWVTFKQLSKYKKIAFLEAFCNTKSSTKDKK